MRELTEAEKLAREIREYMESVTDEERERYAARGIGNTRVYGQWEVVVSLSELERLNGTGNA